MMQAVMRLVDPNAPLMIPPPGKHPEKTQGGKKFIFTSKFKPAGDQPQAIKDLTAGLKAKTRDQVLLGVTGSGKTYTMAQTIFQTQRPALILAPNKTLAAQLYGEFKDFFPQNAVEYFVSYYDYYQPEAYVPRTDTYIEKESSVNEQIDRMRHAATRALLERDDVIVVASVSCIYGIGSVESYSEMAFAIERGQTFHRKNLLAALVALHYKRNDQQFMRGTFRALGDCVDIFPSHYEDRAWRIDLFGDEVENICEFDPLTGKKSENLNAVRIYPNSHYVTPRPTLNQALNAISRDLATRLDELSKNGQLLEAQRLEQRTNFDIEMIKTTGACAGIENYSRYLTGRTQGQPPPTLFEYLSDNAIIFVDESHVSVPQLGGMFRGDFQRKRTLAAHGFRLPACVDNRPLRFEEWDHMRPQTIYVSATPGSFELEQTKGAFIDQVIRPTGLTDPEVIVRPATNQVDDLIDECHILAQKKQRALVTVLTKRMAEDLTEYMHEQNIKVRYMHSDINTLERIEIIHDLRAGAFDVLVGINLLREGLDIPECALAAILDADKEGFLRSETSLVQTIGRAARNHEGRAILYADKITGSMRRAIDETKRRQKKQALFNKKHNITPTTIHKDVKDILGSLYNTQEQDKAKQNEKGRVKTIRNLADFAQNLAEMRKQMIQAADDLKFEEAAQIRDEIRRLEQLQLALTENPLARPEQINWDSPPPRTKAGLPGTRTIKSKSTSKRGKLSVSSK